MSEGRAAPRASKRSAALPTAVRELYPWSGHTLETADGHLQHYLDHGSGPTLLMVHGNPTWSFYYRDLVHGLCAEHRCVVPDHLGCGLSDKPARWGYRIPDHVDNLCALIEALDLRDITLVVHDWGGAIGYAAAIRMPSRFRRFVVFNTGAFLLPLPFSLRALRIPGYGHGVVQGLNGFLRLGMRFAVGHADRFQGAVRQGYFAPYGSWAERQVIRRFIEEIPIEADHPNRALLQILDQGLPTLLGHPHLVVWGLRDWIFHPGYLAGWRERLPQGEFHVLEDCSHWVVEEASERILPLMRDFLGRHPLTSSG
jgi:cis-3-alkyl-4-acyloxetan-2-one decarboxylase